MAFLETKNHFKTTADFELGMANHQRETDYFMVKDDAKKPDGLVVYVPGFGEDGKGNYAEVFCRKMALNYNLAAITVNYHCRFCRKVEEEYIAYETEDIFKIEKLFLRHQQPFQGATVAEGVQALNQYLASSNQTESISATLLPEKNEYQNGGILQALDIINAVEDALKNYPDIPHNNIILVGSSYGGYIANMATKIAPRTFRAVFDNSSWVHPNYTYLVGREINSAEVSAARHSNITTVFYVKSAWTLKTNLPNTFDENRFEIRDFTEKQLSEMLAENLQTFYYFVHAENDYIASTEDKINLVKTMVKKGMNVYLAVMGKEDIDGKYVKNAEHSMGLSMLELFARGYTEIKDHKVSKETDFDLASKITYPVKDYQYVFDYSEFPIKAYTEDK